MCAAAAVLLLLLAACSNGAVAEDPGASDEGDVVSIRYGMLKSVSPIFLSIENGYFEDEGISVTVDFMQSGSDLIPLLASDQMDAGESSAAAGLYNALARDVDVSVVADAGQLTAGSGVAALVVRQDLLDSGEVTALSDLRGKAVAITAEGSAMQLLMLKALEDNGLAHDEVNLVTMAFPAMLSAMASEDVAAAMLTEPFISQAQSSGQASILIPGDEIEANGQQVVLMYSPSLAKDDKVGDRFMRAWLRGVRDYLAAFGPEAVNKDAVVSALSRHLGMDAATIESGLPKGLAADGALNRESLESRQDFFVELGLVPSPVAIDSFVDESFRQRALKGLDD
jgi:NitT/TauT family transport system substrate-binding protein